MIGTHLGLNAHTGDVWDFDGLFSLWMSKNGIHNETELAEISKNYKGLPITIRIPVVVFNKGASGEDIVQIDLHHTEWYGVYTPEVKKKCLISMSTKGTNLCWVVEYKWTPNNGNLTLLTGEYSTEEEDKESIVRKWPVFTLIGTDDVEKLLSCYFNLRELNNMQILDFRERKIGE